MLSPQLPIVSEDGHSSTDRESGEKRSTDMVDELCSSNNCDPSVVVSLLLLTSREFGELVFVT